MVPVVGGRLSAVGKEITKLHAGGKMKKTGLVRLSKGELVLNKGQQTRLRKAKSAATKAKIIAQVAKRRPKPMKGKRRRK